MGHPCKKMSKLLVVAFCAVAAMAAAGDGYDDYDTYDDEICTTECWVKAPRIETVHFEKKIEKDSKKKDDYDYFSSKKYVDDYKKAIGTKFELDLTTQAECCETCVRFVDSKGKGKKGKKGVKTDVKRNDYCFDVDLVYEGAPLKKKDAYDYDYVDYDSY
eukprot:Rmarinus@m.24356